MASIADKPDRRCNTVRLANPVLGAQPLYEENKDWKNRLPLCLSPEAMSVGGRINEPEGRQLNDLFLCSIPDGPRYAAPAAWNLQPGKADRRYREMVQIYWRAAEWSVQLWPEMSAFGIRSLDQVDTFRFPSKTLDRHHFLFGLKTDPRMDSQSALVVMQPPLHLQSNVDSFDESEKAVGKRG
ncbi:hypothetical protein V8E54_005055 [Elaphomyces granulatus]